MKKLTKQNLIGITALLVHAAKIDEKYTNDEKKLILKFIEKIDTEKNDKNGILISAEKLEGDSNQLLSFTNAIKSNTDEFKYEIIEELWKLIISDNSVDEYESNLMRRICGLIYFSDKISGEIKLKVLNLKN
tara:strand:- start:303 stop:698 length:396 start_codon:yes stop_codon:yes gene_type:complete